MRSMLREARDSGLGCAPRHACGPAHLAQLLRRNGLLRMPYGEQKERQAAVFRVFHVLLWAKHGRQLAEVERRGEGPHDALEAARSQTQRRAAACLSTRRRTCANKAGGFARAAVCSAGLRGLVPRRSAGAREGAPARDVLRPRVARARGGRGRSPAIAALVAAVAGVVPRFRAAARLGHGHHPQAPHALRRGREGCRKAYRLLISRASRVRRAGRGDSAADARQQI